MLKLIKYFKPYTHFIILAILLLFVQAMSDLALPDFMSRIVNTGIQQGGIDNAVPEVLRSPTMEKIILFMDKDTASEIKGLYKLINADSRDYVSYLNKYPVLESEELYVLKDFSFQNNPEINLIIGKALMMVAGIERAKSEAKDGFMEMNGVKIPASADMFSIIKNMNQERRLEMLSSVDKTIEVLGEGTVVQTAVLFIKEEYESIGIETGKLQSKFVWNTGFKMLLIALLSATCTITVALIASRVAAGSARDIRQDLFKKVQNFSSSDLINFSTASLITRTTNDVTQIQLVTVMIIRMVFLAPIMGIGGIIKAFEKSPSMSWIIALAVIVLLGLVAVVFVIALPKFKKIQKLIDRLNLVTRENLSGLMVIRAFNTQKFEENRFDEANRDVTATSLFVNRVMVIMMPIMMLVMNGITILIVWTGAHEIAQSSMQVGDMMAFMQYAMQIIFSFLMLTIMFIMIPRASISASRIAEVLTLDLQIKDPENPKLLGEDVKGVVEYKDVCFKFPGAQEPMLKNISFKALPGQITAIIGSTGSGKSTLLNMLPRFYDVCGGQVLLDGIDVRDVNQHELRDKIGFVPQKGFLFSGTVESNLRYADQNATDDELKKATMISQAYDFVSSNPDGFEQHISQGGNNVSGGQKQRLAIARALVKKPPVFLFDDSFSALDYKTDAALRRKLKEETGQSTMIIVGQRIATIKNAEQIIVLDEGEIVGKGTHKQLMSSCKIYQEIARSQLSEEELA